MSDQGGDSRLELEFRLHAQAARIDALEAALQGWHMAGDILNERIGRLEAALRFALEVMESYSKLDGRDPSHATPSSAIGVARAALAPEQDK